MLILALDTTSRAGSVALARDAGVLDQQRGDPSRTHGERLPGDIGDLLERHGLTVADVDLYAVAAGPGSFTGLRVGDRDNSRARPGARAPRGAGFGPCRAGPRGPDLFQAVLCRMPS